MGDGPAGATPSAAGAHWRNGRFSLAFTVLSEPTDAALERLIARTEGPQPWRKAFHAVNAVTIAAVLWIVGGPRWLLVAATGALAGGLLLADVLRLRRPALNALFFRVFSRLASPREARGVASSTWYAVGIFAAVALFPLPEAVGGILVMGVADPAAAVVGRTFGSRPFLGGTVEGTLAFFLTSLAILAFPFGLAAAAPAALAAALAERRSWPLDDNLAVPLVCACTLVAMRWLGLAG